MAEQEQTTQIKGSRKELIFNEADEEEEEVEEEEEEEVPLWQLQSNCEEIAGAECQPTVLRRRQTRQVQTCTVRTTSTHRA